MVWGRTSGGEELRGNRLVVNSQVIAYLPRNSLNMSCSPFIKNSSLEELCHKRLEFFSNTTTILVKLRNLSSDEHWNFTLTHVLGSSSPCNPQDIKILRVIVPSPVLLSTVSAVANNTVRIPISVIPSSISTTVAGTSSRVQNTIRPPTTETTVLVRPRSPSAHITFPSASLTTSVVPSVVNTVSPDGQGKSDDPPTRVGTTAPMSTVTSSTGPGNKIGAVIGGTIGAVAAFFLFIFLIRGIAVWYKKRHRRQRDDEGTANESQNHMMCFDQSGCRILTHTQT